MTTVVVVDEAEEPSRDRRVVACEPSAAPTLVIDEFERCMTLLESSPDIGACFHRTFVPGVRRLVMKKTQHLVYYVRDAENAVVYAIAVWGAPKEGDPVLRDPR